MENKPANFEFSNYEKNYSEDGFWEKIKSAAKKAGSHAIHSALLLFYASKSPDTPTWAKTIIFGALGYFILPIDVIPDILPGMGFIDDLAMISTAVSLVAANITQDVKLKAGARMNEWFVKEDMDDENIDEQ